MKKFFYVAIAATALASCSSDNLVDLKEGDEIKITAVADNDSRAATVYCQNNLPEEFTLYANVGEANYIAGEVYTSTTDGYTTEAHRYWPEVLTTPLQFYAVHNNQDINWVAGEAPTGTFTPVTTVTEQKDFIYAAKAYSERPDGGTAILNFRHALSQIEFRVKNGNEDLKIDVYAVKVGNALASANYTLPSSTDEQVVYHEEGGEIPAFTVNSVISWEAPASKTYEFYTATLADAVTATADGVSLTVPVGQDGAFDEEGNFSESNSMLLLPQTTNAWTPGGAQGAYLAVKCKIYNVCDEDNVLLYGGTDGRWAYVPVAFNWKPGCKYVYTFNFANGGNAGYDDSDNENVPGTSPVLVDLKVDVTVDDFVPADGVDTEMKADAL